MKNYEKELDDFIKAIKESTKILKDFNEQAEARAIEKIAFSKEKFMWDNWKSFVSGSKQLQKETKEMYAIKKCATYEKFTDYYYNNKVQDFVMDIRFATLFSSESLAIDIAEHQIKDKYQIVKVKMTVEGV